MVGGREREDDDDGEEVLEKQTDEKIRMETCCITDVDVMVTSLPNSRLNLLETPQKTARRDCPGGKLRVTFSEEELEIHGDDVEDTQDNPSRWSKLSRPPYMGWDNPFSPAGNISQDADLIVRCWKEKKLAQMYCDILEEEEEVAVVKEEPTGTDGEVTANAVEETNYAEEKVQTKIDSPDITTVIEMKSDPEKFKANCCTVS